MSGARKTGSGAAGAADAVGVLVADVDATGVVAGAHAVAVSATVASTAAHPDNRAERFDLGIDKSLTFAFPDTD
ncbi:hypothetical protein [Glaciihabitans tibetensis]|uniref:hypothetical protein n=1 Tax=Glaciihabitans tibetensis TaxID=1266600 RepID=UPI0015E7B48E|nr:hypothetical protein [Glaciihabitans tibetensis]